jgi:hypothetical protein
MGASFPLALDHPALAVSCPSPRDLSFTSIGWQRPGLAAFSQSGEFASPLTNTRRQCENEADTWHYRVPALHIDGGGNLE